jgi:hypothetical protein
MSGKKSAGRKAADRESAQSRSADRGSSLASGAPPATIAPMTPRRQLLVIFGLMLLLWIGMMVVIYCAVVYPHRYPATPPASTAVR